MTTSMRRARRWSLAVVLVLLPALLTGAQKTSAQRHPVVRPAPDLNQPAPIGLPKNEGPSVAERAPAPFAPVAADVGSRPVEPRIAPETTASPAAALVITAITPTPSLPIPWGTQISWTASSTGGIAPVQYAFYLYSYQTSSWSLVKPYSTSNVFSWTPTQADIGQYVIQVWGRNAGSSANYDAWNGTPTFSILSNAPTITSFTANTTFPKIYGSPITWTVTTTGGIAPIQYFFARYSYATSTWSIAQNYSTSNTFTWTPTQAEMGKYALQAWVLSAGSTAPYDAYIGSAAFDIVGPPPTTPSFAPPPAVPSPAGVPLTFSAVSTGGVAPLQYEFFLYSYATGAWSLAQAYSANASWTWIPTPSDVGPYVVQVWVKNAGSPSAYDAWNGMSFAITPQQPLALVGIGMLPGLPRPVGTQLVWQAATTGGMAPLNFQWWRYSYTSGTWTMIQDWGTSNILSWTPALAEAGDYVLQVWARNAGSTATYDAWNGTARFTVQPPTTDIVRFLEQASWGPTDAEIERVRQLGMSGWIDNQLAMPLMGLPVYSPVPDNPAAACSGNCQRDNYSVYPLQRLFFMNALYGQDQLRYRVSWALHSLVVSSGLDLALPSWFQPYYDVLYRNAFGNYRQLLYEVTLNPGMGEYLNMNTSTKTNPNENYAREIMQLFSVGTDLLNLDGTPQRLADGSIIPVYDQFAVTELARTFTGWRFANAIGSGITNYRDPMVAVTANHDIGSKTLLQGFVVAPGQTPLKDLNDAIDNLFNHPNTGPYVAKALIRALVTSNPSGPYVQRIATVFNNNGSGVRGDLGAVVKAILLDPEARQTAPSDPKFGHLKDPLLMVTQFLRAMHVRSADGTGQSDGYLSPNLSNLGQDIFRPPTVFSYYPADYQAPGTTILGPEFGIYQTTTTLRRANFVNTMVFSTIPISANAPNGTSIDLSLLTTLAGAPDMMLKELDRLLLHDTMSAQMKTTLMNAINAISPSNPLLRAQTALYLVATSSQYQVER